jgi:hypothetical protein
VLSSISFDGFALAPLGREALAYERVSKLTFNPLAPILGGRLRNWGTPPNPRQRGFAPLHAPKEMQETSCRESEGVPQMLFLSIPQEWGIKGVEDGLFGQPVQK